MSIGGTYSQERINVMRAYPGKKWAQKVMQMSDGQVHEIWVSLQNRAAKSKEKRDQKQAL